jgi:gamma-glutamyltranspeptidase/glutathione hydrolase
LIPPGVERCVVPAAPDAWVTALEQFGTMSFGEVAAAAIRFAREGFPMYPPLTRFLTNNRARYERWPSSAKVFLPNGRVPQPGEIFVQSELGATLQFLADEEKRAAARGGREAGLAAVREAFYRGDIAAQVVKFIRDQGGLMSCDDFAGYRVSLEPTVKSRFGDIELHACGPWSQGPVLPMTLNVLKGYDLKGLGHNSPAYIHLLTEAMKLSFADRHNHFGDPKFVSVPLEGLLSERYAEYRRSLIRTGEAWPEMPPAGDPATLRAVANRWMPSPESEHGPGPGDTSYICVVDKDRNAFSATPSDGSDQTPLIPGVGIVCSGRGTQSWADPEHPSSVAPGKRPRLTPNPAIAFKGGELCMPFGTPSGDVQTQAMLQVFLNIHVFGMAPQDAVEAPRFATYSFPGSFQPHPYFPGRLQIENRFAPSVSEALERLGHKVHRWDDWTPRAGSVCVILNDPVHGVLHGGADPRRPAYVLGW